ncbi:MAG: glutaredoxin family protein [Acidimicrobiia bacterium]
MTELWLRLAIVIAAVALSLLIIVMMRRRPGRSETGDVGGLDPAVYLFTSATCVDCAGARARLTDLLGSVGYVEIRWEDEPGLFTRLGVDGVPCTVVVGGDGSASLHPGMPGRALRVLNP